MTTVCLVRRVRGVEGPRVSASTPGSRPTLKISVDLIFHDVESPSSDLVECLGQIQALSPDLVLLDASQRCERPSRGRDVAVPGIETIDDAGLRETVARLCARIGDLVSEPMECEDDRIPMSIGRRTHLVPRDGIDAIVAQRNYVDVYVGDRVYTVRCSLSWFERTLDPDRFLRVHRSSIVRVSAIEEIGLLGSGRYRIALHGGKSFRSGRNYRARVCDLLCRKGEARHPASPSQRAPSTSSGVSSR